MPTAHRTPIPRPTARSSRANTAHRAVTGGIGHNLPQEAPQAFAEAIVEVDSN
jgi:pimeloyl-ACP methyl ester carboxylesterase